MSAVVRSSDSSQTIPCPAVPCSYELASGARCHFNCAEGLDRCVMHPRRARAVRLHSGPIPAPGELQLARERAAYWAAAALTATGADAQHVARTEAKAWADIVIRLERKA